MTITLTLAPEPDVRTLLLIEARREENRGETKKAKTGKKGSFCPSCPFLLFLLPLALSRIADCF